MTTAQVSLFIPAPIQYVFDRLSDHDRYQELNTVSASALLKPGDIDTNGVGALRELRVWSLRFIEEVTYYDAPFRLDYRVRECYLCPGNTQRQIHFPLDHKEGVMLFEKQNGGTAVHWHSRYNVDLPGGRLIACLLRPIVQRAFANILKDVRQLAGLNGMSTK